MTFKSAWYFGNNYPIAQTINRRIPLTDIVCERRSFNQDIFNLAKVNEIGFHVIDSVLDLKTIPLPSAKDTVAFSYGVSIIFPSDFIRQFTHGIWNIHPGELPQNRGRHPIAWNFLNGHNTFGICIHQINTQIDRGLLLAEGDVVRDLNDTQEEIETKMEDLFESSLLDTALDNYQNDIMKELSEGTYNKNLIGAFDNVTPTEQTSTFMFNLLKSQKKYGGITVNGKRYTVCVFVHQDFRALYEGDIFVCKDNQMVALQ
jgi:methionyl-tRNA formyltransferase